jgi:hypothetical protein
MFRHKGTIFRERSVPGFKAVATDWFKAWHIMLSEDGTLLPKCVGATYFKNHV